MEILIDDSTTKLDLENGLVGVVSHAGQKAGLRKRLVNRHALITGAPAFCVKSDLGGSGEGFPVVWEQLLDPADRMRGHSREHIAEPGKRLDRIPLAHRDEA